MDKVYYYVRRVDNSLNSYREELDGLSDLVLVCDKDELATFDEEEAGGDEEPDSSGTDDDDLHDLDPISVRVLAKWNARRKKLVNDWSLTGYMFSPLPEIMQDVRDNEEEAGKCRDAVERLFKKLFFPRLRKDETSEEYENAVNKMWDEYEFFISRSHTYGHKVSLLIVVLLHSRFY